MYIAMTHAIWAPLIDASIDVFPPHHKAGKTLWVEIKNNSHLTYELKRRGDIGPGHITLTADSTVLVKIDNASGINDLDLQYEAENLLIGPEKELPVTLTIKR